MKPSPDRRHPVTQAGEPGPGRVGASVAVVLDSDTDLVGGLRHLDDEPGGARVLEHVRHALRADEPDGGGDLGRAFEVVDVSLDCEWEAVDKLGDSSREPRRESRHVESGGERFELRLGKSDLLR